MCVYIYISMMKQIERIFLLMQTQHSAPSWVFRDKIERIE